MLCPSCRVEILAYPAAFAKERGMAQVDTDRFVKDLNDLRKIGEFKTGVHRPTFSDVDMQSRHWLMDRMKECGLEPIIDGIGNVFGKHPGSASCQAWRWRVPACPLTSSLSPMRKATTAASSAAAR
jgi:hypothetical protein